MNDTTTQPEEQPKKHKTTPIKDSITKLTRIGLPRSVTLYQIPGSSYWWVRVWMNGRMVKKTTKNDIKQEAIKFAKNFFYELLRKTQDGTKTTQAVSHVFERMCLSLLKEDQQKVIDGDRSERLVKDQELVINKDLIPFFHTVPIKQISYQKITEYMAGLSERKLAPNTRKFHLITLRKILKHAIREQVLERMPEFPIIKRRDSKARPAFTEAQYETLKAGINKAIKEKVVIDGHPITVELRLLCIFMIGTFVRVTDIKTLKNSMITVKKENRRRYLVLELVSKVKPKPIVTLSSAVDVYEEMRQINKAKGFDKPDDYVWFAENPKRRPALATMNHQLNYILNETGLKKAPNGGTRSLGSLRSSAITFALLHSQIDTATLASNCRTSPEVIHSNYYSLVENEKAIAKIQERKR